MLVLPTKIQKNPIPPKKASDFFSLINLHATSHDNNRKPKEDCHDGKQGQDENSHPTHDEPPVPPPENNNRRQHNDHTEDDTTQRGDATDGGEHSCEGHQNCINDEV